MLHAWLGLVVVVVRSARRTWKSSLLALWLWFTLSVVHKNTGICPARAKQKRQVTLESISCWLSSTWNKLRKFASSFEKEQSCSQLQCLGRARLPWVSTQPSRVVKGQRTCLPVNYVKEELIIVKKIVFSGQLIGKLWYTLLFHFSFFGNNLNSLISQSVHLSSTAPASRVLMLITKGNIRWSKLETFSKLLTVEIMQSRGLYVVSISHGNWKLSISFHLSAS